MGEWVNENVCVCVSDSVLSEDADIIDWEIHNSKTFTKACFLSLLSLQCGMFLYTPDQRFFIEFSFNALEQEPKASKGGQLK